MRTLNHPAGRCRLRITGVGRPGGFDQQQVHFFFSYRAVLHPLGHDEQLSRLQMNVPIPQLNDEVPLQHQEEIIRFVVLVPCKLALQLDHHEVMTVELAHRSGLPVLGKRRELVCEIDALHRPPSE